MRKDFGVKTWAYPMPVYIVAAYDKDGAPCCMNAAWGGILLEKSGADEAVNFDFIVRIREYPRGKNGKKKSVIFD